MSTIKKRLDRLETVHGPDTCAKEMDSPARAAMREFAFHDWRKSRIAGGLPADREIYNAKKAEEEASDAAAWAAHLATLLPEERESIGLGSRYNPTAAYVRWLLFRRGLPEAAKVIRDNP